MPTSTPTAADTPPSRTGARQGARLRSLVARHHLHPELDLHASWWPSQWPASHRGAGRFGPQGQAVLSRLVRGGVFGPGLGDGAFDDDFDAPVKRLVLLDGRSLRLLAVACGLAAHRDLFRQWGWAGQARRQARRWAPDAADFIEERVPALPLLPMNMHSAEQRPQGLGQLMLRRGHRLLMALLAAEAGPRTLARARMKFPRRFAGETLPALSEPQRRQLEELVLSCIVPERIPEWDWLF